jgi:Carboxypeptidase regulatory-like domain
VIVLRPRQIKKVGISLMPRAALPSFFLVSVALFCAATTLPQGEITSAIARQVTDASSAAISGALVTITNSETGLQRRATADEQGRFNFPQLKPGAYSVRAEAEGFDPQQNDNVISGLGQKQTVQFTLRVTESNNEGELKTPGAAIPIARSINPVDAVALLAFHPQLSL